ncbi:hypothetical protein ANN_09462 [Periplaneta americana]|uniref:Reverse transcriptase domain-containing protein n=1 Tax=Periplaneta americana TaxID=6978 RepID=A0ABQ8TNX8_PERAM|nr:hypothetical protein ANN_09462 [Periplaneta americana]
MGGGNEPSGSLKAICNPDSGTASTENAYRVRVVIATDSDLSSELSVKLQRAQNMCVRYVCNIRRYDHISPSFASFRGFRLKERRTLHSLSLLFRILHTLTPNYLSSRFSYLYFNHDMKLWDRHEAKAVTSGIGNKLKFLTGEPRCTEFLRCCKCDGSYPQPVWDKFFFKYINPTDVIKTLRRMKSKAQVNQYRPISILPTTSKALEHIVHGQLTNYLDEHKLLDDYQSGFRHGHSTTTALLKVTEDIREAMDRGEVTALTLLDFSNAFGSVDIDLLLAKMKALHLSDNTLSWMDSYLRDCQQCVSLDNQFSQWRYTKAGVPQGSVLGPLLFSIYINDISKNLQYCRYHLYADDLQLYIHSRPNTINESIDKLNCDLVTVSTWAANFGLALNPNTCATSDDMITYHLPSQVFRGFRLKERRTLHSLSLLFRILHTLTPNYLSSRFSYLYSNHDIMSQSKSGVKRPPFDPDVLMKAVEAVIAPPGNNI